MAMDVMTAAARIEQSGRHVVHMELGQPAAPAPSMAVAAAQAALAGGRLGYTESLGLPNLRRRIARHYQDAYGLAVDPATVVVTTGSSAAFTLAFLSLLEPGDRVGLATYAGTLVEMVPPSTRHLNLVMHALGRARPMGEGALPPAIDRVADVATRPGIVVIVTDCYAEPAALGRSVDALRARGHDVLVFHLLDRAEETFPFDASAVFEDGETALRLPLRPDEVRDRYLGLWRAHRQALERRFAAAGVDYVPLHTDEPLDRALYAFLDHRLSRSRVR